MAAPVLNNNTEFVQVNTQANAGTLTLPNASELPGRILTFKDIMGSFPQNPFTLTTSAGNTFDDGTRSKILRERFGFIKVASDGVSRWNVLEGTQMPMFTISSLNAVAGLSTIMMSTAQMTVSTLQLNDTLLPNVQSNLYTSSSLLYCGTQIVGGTKVASGPTLVIRPLSPFIPSQLLGLKVWYDAADLNTLTIDVSGSVRQWRDKSGFRVNLTGYGSPSLTRENGLPAISFANPPFWGGSALAAGKNYFATPGGNTSTDNVSFVGWFAVARPTIASMTNATLIGNTYGPGGLSKNNLYINGTSFLNFFRLVTGGTSYSSGTTANIGSLNLVYSYTDYSTGTSRVFVNGTGGSVASFPTGTLDSATSALQIGWGGYFTNNGFTGTICECLLYTFTGGNTLSSDQQQRIEGYLAWKWGTVGSLPSTHLYKRVPPLEFTLYNTPYFVTTTGGSGLTFTFSFSYNLTQGNTVNQTNLLFYNVADGTLASTSSDIGTAVSFTTDGTTNASTGKLGTALSFGFTYVVRVRINILPALGFSLSSSTPSLLYGGAAAAATSPAFTATGETLGVSWSRANNTVLTPMNNTFILFYTNSAGTGSFVRSTDRTTATTFTTDGTSATGNLVANLSFNSNYYFRVGTSNIVNTTYTLSEVSAAGLYGAAALPPTSLASASGGATISISWNRNSTNARPSNNTKVFFYTNAAGTTLARESTDIGAVSLFTTNGTVETGQMNSSLVFNTNYYLRVGTSNALTTGGYQTSSWLSSAVLFGDKPIAATIASYGGGATMTATLISSPTLSQPVNSSNVYFLASDGTTVVATKTNYTGSSSYSTTGVSSEFTTGSLVFNTNYYMKVTLFNPLGSIDTVTTYPSLFGSVPAVGPTNPVLTALVYYGTRIVLNYTPPGNGTLGAPVTSVSINAYVNGGSTIIRTGISPTATQQEYDLETGNYGLATWFELYSVNALGIKYGSATFSQGYVRQYQFSWRDPIVIEGEMYTMNWTYYTASRSDINITGVVTYIFVAPTYINFLIRLNSLKASNTLTWSYSINYSSDVGFYIDGVNYTNGESNSGVTTVYPNSVVRLYVQNNAYTFNDTYYGLRLTVS